MGAAEDALKMREQRRLSPTTFLGGSAVLGGPVGQSPAELALSMRDRRRREITDDEFDARFVGQDSIKGPPLDAKSRFLISVLGDTSEERQLVVDRFMPGAELLEVPDTGTVLFRKSPGEQFRKADPGLFESLGEGFSEFAKELGRDVSDFGGETFIVAGEALALAARFPGGGPAVKVGMRALFKLATGAALGELGQQGVQEASRTNVQGPREIGEQAVFEAGMSFVGGTLGAGVVKAGNVALRGGGMLGTREGAREAIQAAERLGVTQPQLSQLSDVPFIQRLSRQAASVLPFLKRQQDKASKELLERVRIEVDPIARGNFLIESSKAFAADRRAILDLVEAEVKFSRKTPRATAEAIDPEFRAWWQRSGGRVDGAYSVARSIEEPQFVLDPALDAARRLREGVFTPARPRTVVQETGILDAAGYPIIEEVTEEGVVRLDRLASGVRQAVDDLLELDPSLPAAIRESGEEISRTDRVRQIIKNLRDEALPGPEGMRESNFVADDLRRTLQQVLDNPTNRNSEFVFGWRRASQMARERFETREAAAVIDMVNRFKEQRPSAYINRLLNSQDPALVDNLIAVRRATSKPAFDEIRNAAVGKIMRDPRKIRATMEKFDDQALRILFPKRSREALLRAGDQLTELFSTNIPDALQRQSQVGAFIRQVFDTNDTANIAALRALVGRSPSVSFGRSVRSSLVDDIIRRSTVVGDDNITKLSGRALRNTLEAFDEKGLLDMLEPETKRILSDARAVAVIQDISVEDPGTALRGASIISQAAQLSLTGIVDLVHLLGVGRILQSPWARRLIIGTGRFEPFEGGSIRLIGAAAAGFATDIDAEAGNRGFAAVERLRQSAASLAGSR